MLSEMLKEKYVQMNLEASSFEDAIRKSTNPLVQDEAISTNYVDEIISILDETGPYIVITKNIALPHAPVSAGAKKMALGFSKLSKPIKSGNEANDPVKYSFPLSVTDRDSHLKALSELVTLFSDETFLNLLEDSNDPNEIIKYIIKNEGNV